MPWRVIFGRAITWRDWVQAVSACSGRACTARPSGPPGARTWRLKCSGLGGSVLVHDRGGNAWDIYGEPFWAEARPFVGSAARALGGTDVDDRTLARETPGVIDYVTGWWDDGLGRVRLVREPAGAFGEIRVLVSYAKSWFCEGGESARVFDAWEKDEDRGPVDVATLLAELRTIGRPDTQPREMFEELVEWLAKAHEDRARVSFERTR